MLKKGFTVETWNSQHGTVVEVVGSKINVQFPDGRRFCSLGDIVSFKEPDDKFAKAKKRLAEFHNTPIAKTEAKPLEVKHSKVAMKLLTQEILNKIPPLRSQEDKGDDAIAYVKFFTPTSDWTWYATEYDPVNREFFGLVQGFEEELGYFSLDELENVKGPMGLGIERDMYFKPTPLKDLRGKTASIDKMAPGKVDESKWDEAKQAIKKSTGKSIEDFGDSEWAQVNKVYQNMGGTFKSKATVGDITAKDFPIGTKVKKTMGVPLEGEIIAPFYYKDADDGSYGEPKKGDVFVQWTDGTKGWIFPQVLVKSSSISGEFAADPVGEVTWEQFRDDFIPKIKKVSPGQPPSWYEFQAHDQYDRYKKRLDKRTPLSKAMSIMTEGLKSEGVYTPELIKKVESMIKKTAGKQFAIDLPDPNNLGGGWVNIDYFSSWKEAMLWAKKNIGSDDQGKISLVSALGDVGEHEMSFAVDLPDPSNFEGESINMDYFDTKEQAIEYVKVAFGGDEEGKIGIISEISNAAKTAGHPNESFKALYALGDIFVPSDGSDDSNQIRIIGMTESAYVVEQRPIGDRKPDKDDKTYGIRFEMKFSEIEGNKELKKFAVKKKMSALIKEVGKYQIRQAEEVGGESPSEGKFYIMEKSTGNEVGDEYNTIEEAENFLGGMPTGTTLSSIGRISSKLEKLSEEQKPNAETPTGNEFGKKFQAVSVNMGEATELWDKINKAGAGLTFETGVSEENKKALDSDLQKLIDIIKVELASVNDLKGTISPTPEPKTESLNTKAKIASLMKKAERLGEYDFDVHGGENWTIEAGEDGKKKIVRKHV